MRRAAAISAHATRKPRSDAAPARFTGPRRHAVMMRAMTWRIFLDGTRQHPEASQVPLRASAWDGPCWSSLSASWIPTRPTLPSLRLGAPAWANAYPGWRTETKCVSFVMCRLGLCLSERDETRADERRLTTAHCCVTLR